MEGESEHQDQNAEYGSAEKVADDLYRVGRFEVVETIGLVLLSEVRERETMLKAFASDSPLVRRCS